MLAGYTLLASNDINFLRWYGKYSTEGYREYNENGKRKKIMERP